MKIIDIMVTEYFSSEFDGLVFTLVEVYVRFVHSWKLTISFVNEKAHL